MQTILLADDHPVVLCGLEQFLSGADFEIVASCRDGSAVLPIIRDKKPDLALLDVDIPGLSGFDVLAATVSEVLSTRVVLLSESAALTDVAEALRNGAWDMISKTVTACEMLDRLRRVAAGYRWSAHCDPDVRSEGAGANRNDYEAIATLLTPREREVTVLVSAGMSNKEIAQRIAVSVGTVKIHLSNIFQKLNLNNRTSLAAVALQDVLRSAPRGSNFGEGLIRTSSNFEHSVRRLTSRLPRLDENLGTGGDPALI
jgi:DNA-binding NarL/FixJ family response regulator